MAETAEEAWKEYRKRGEAVETFEEFKARWEKQRDRDNSRERTSDKF